MLSSESTVLVLFVEDSIIVRFVLHPGINQMKAIWHHSKFKQIWTTITCLNTIQALCYHSKSSICFLSHKFTYKFLFNEKKICKIKHMGNFMAYMCFHTTQCVRILPSNGTGTFRAKTILSGRSFGKSNFGPIFSRFVPILRTFRPLLSQDSPIIRSLVPLDYSAVLL